MKVPEDPDNKKWNNGEFPHFTVFCNVQLARPCVYPGEHFENAKVIAVIPDDEITTITLEGLIGKGLVYATQG
jgi:hypothetical protein